MSKQQDRLLRIAGVEREYLAATVALDMLEERLRADPALLVAHELRFRDARNLRMNLEATFLLRLYAEFEAGLRDAWQHAFGRDTQPPMKDLMTSIAGRCIVPQDRLDQAKAIREYRNALVREGEAKAVTLTLAEARRGLCRFFSHLPWDW